METHPAPEPASIVNGEAKPKQVYDWDRVPEQERIAKMPFPVPKNSQLSFAELSEYYNALRPLPIGRYAKLYVQRWWPVLLPVETLDDFGNVKDSFPNDVKIVAEDGPLSQQLILQLAGVGEYRFRLNDTRRPWKQSTVVFSELEVTDPSLWTLHPPIIDPKRLDLDAKRNQAYIKFARAHGYLPREGEEEKEQTDMAQVQAIDTVLEDSRKERERTDALQRDTRERLERDLKEAKDAAAKAQAAKPEAVRPTTDLEAMGGVIVSLVNAVKPNPDNSLSEYLKLEAAREETRRQTEAAEREAARESARTERARADLLQAEVLADLRKKAEPAAPVAMTAPKTDVDVLEEMVKKQNLLKQLTGRGGSAAEEAEKPSNIDKWLEAMPFLAPIAQSFIGGIFQTIHFGFQTWQTISYNNALGKNAEPKPPTTMDKPPEPGKPIQAQGPPPTPEQQAQAQQMPLILAGVAKLIGPLQRALNNSKTGDEFAESMIDFTEDGRADYDKIRNVAQTLTSLGMQVPGQPGIEQFKAAAGFLFQQFPAFYQKVATLPTFGVFLEEFFNFDEIRAQQDQK
jgi:hypothetical protein